MELLQFQGSKALGRTSDFDFVNGIGSSGAIDPIQSDRLVELTFKFELWMHLEARSDRATAGGKVGKLGVNSPLRYCESL